MLGIYVTTLISETSIDLINNSLASVNEYGSLIASKIQLKGDWNPSRCKPKIQPKRVCQL